MTDGRPQKVRATSMLDGVARIHVAQIFGWFVMHACIMLAGRCVVDVALFC